MPIISALSFVKVFISVVSYTGFKFDESGFMILDSNNSY
jgi:hypothetical protein